MADPFVKRHWPGVPAPLLVALGLLSLAGLEILRAWGLRQAAGAPVTLGRQALACLPMATAWVLLLGLPMAAVRRGGEGWRRLGWQGWSALRFVLLASLLERGLAVLLGTNLRLAHSDHMGLALLGALGSGLPAYALAALLTQALDHRASLQEALVHQAQLERERVETRLQALEAQLQPHFLFNALNALVGHLPPEAQAARSLALDLSAFLRRSLAGSAQAEVSLREDLELARLYMAIQASRHGDRFTCTWDVAPECLDLRVPHLLLQPLLENALKHGLAPRPGPGRVGVEARRAGVSLVVRVTDDGLGGLAAVPGMGTGTGLANLRRRLALLHGDRAHLEAAPREGGGFEVCLTLPGRLA